MGACASTQRSSSEPTMKLRLSFESKADKLVIPPSPIKEKPANGDRPISDAALKSQWSPYRSTATTFVEYGSKEETFFDTKQWLESDSEDDFYSVIGDFTPSRGNTPVHHNFKKSPFVNKTPNSSLQPSPTDKKKKLAELFRESAEDDDDYHPSDDQKTGQGEGEVKQNIVGLPPRSANGTPFVSGTNSVCSSERTSNVESMFEKEKPMRSVQCCLPSFVSCRSFSERKKKMRPAIAVNGKY